MKKTRKELVTASIEISVIFILTIALIIMFAAFCSFKNSTSYSDAPKMDFSTTPFMPDMEIQNESPTGILSPAFIGIVTEKKLAPSDSVSRTRLLNDAIPFLLNAFSDVSTILEFSSDNARIDYINKNLYSANNYLYINFANDIPAGAIIPSVNGKTRGDVYHAFNVRELFIFCDSDGEISGASIDSKGMVSTLTVRDRTSLSFETLRAYEEDGGMKKFEFAQINNRKYPVMSNSVARNNLTAYNNSGDFLTGGSADVQNILSAFGFNPNGTRFYRTGNDSITYVEDSGELRISSAGDVTYTAIENGISLSAASPNDYGLSFQDKISAAYSAITNLNRSYFGGAAKLTLSSVFYDGNSDKMTLRFGYSVNGCEIENGTDFPDAEFVFGKDRLVFAKVNAKSYTLLESTYTDIPQKLLFAFSMQELDAEKLPDTFVPIYKQNNESAAYEAKYAFIYSMNNGEEVENNEGAE